MGRKTVYGFLFRLKSCRKLQKAAVNCIRRVFNATTVTDFILALRYRKKVLRVLLFDVRDDTRNPSNNFFNFLKMCKGHLLCCMMATEENQTKFFYFAVANYSVLRSADRSYKQQLTLRRLPACHQRSYRVSSINSKSDSFVF